MSRRFFTGPLVLLVWALVASPASAQSRREMQMMADVRMLQEQTQQLQQQLQAALAQLAEQLKAISSRVDEQSVSSRKSFADQKLVVDQFGSDLRVVRERIDESNVRITSLSQEVEALRLAMPQVPSMPSAAIDPAAPATTDPNAAATPTAPVPPSPTMAGISPQRLYATAMADFTSGQWALCVDGFNSYLKSFSRNDAADDAQFYIGECYYSDGKFPQALDAYNRVITVYPKGDRVPDAYYKRGLAFQETGQPDRARESWETLMKQYPDSDLSRLAKQSLDRLKSRPPG